MNNLSFPEDLLPPKMVAIADRCATLRDAALYLAERKQPASGALCFGVNLGMCRVMYQAPFEPERINMHSMELTVVEGYAYSGGIPSSLHVRWDDERFEIVEYRPGSWEDELLHLADCVHENEVACRCQRRKAHY